MISRGGDGMATLPSLPLPPPPHPKSRPAHCLPPQPSQSHALRRHPPQRCPTPTHAPPPRQSNIRGTGSGASCPCTPPTAVHPCATLTNQPVLGLAPRRVGLHKAAALQKVLEGPPLAFELCLTGLLVLQYPSRQYRRINSYELQCRLSLALPREVSGRQHPQRLPTSAGPPPHAATAAHSGWRGLARLGGTSKPTHRPLLLVHPVFKQLLPLLAAVHRLHGKRHRRVEQHPRQRAKHAGRQAWRVSVALRSGQRAAAAPNRLQQPTGADQQGTPGGKQGCRELLRHTF